MAGLVIPKMKMSKPHDALITALTLNVVTENFSVTFSTTLSESLKNPHIQQIV